MKGEVCLATEKLYDHKAVRSKMSDEQIYAGLVTANHQHTQAWKGDPIDCATCERKKRLIHMHRCWFCGRYFCPACSREHFGRRN